MRIIIYGINYAPELTGIGKYTGEMASWLAQQGHAVEMVTALPYYPEWQRHKQYSKNTWRQEKIGGVDVHRSPLYVPSKLSALKRIAHEITFLASSLPVLLRLLIFNKVDIVLCVSPPFHLALVPVILKKICKFKLVCHIQDLQVDAAKELGMIKNQTILNIMFGMEKFILKACDRVSTISVGMQRKIKLKGLSKSQLLLFPNWVDERAIGPLPVEKSLRLEFGIPVNSKVILYSGNLGEKQGLEMIVEVAKFYQDSPNVYFVIVGSGGGKENLIRLSKEAALTNILFFPLQPYEKLSALLAMADIHLVLQKKSASDLVLPSKLTAILASGGCSLVTATPDSSLYDIISKYNLGIIVEPESISALKEGIDIALNDDLTIYKRNSREYSELYLSKEAILKAFEKELIAMLQNQ